MKKKIHFGIILPASNITIEHEFFSIINSDNPNLGNLYFHFARAGFKTRYEISPEIYLQEIINNLPMELEKLSKIDILSCSFLCTSGSVILKNNPEIVEKCYNIYEKRLITPIESLRNALKSLSIHSPLIITPYSQKISVAISEALSQDGITPGLVMPLNLKTSIELYEHSRSNLLDLLKKELDKKKYDGICILCTNYPTFDLIEILENKYNLPVITSNQATLREILNSSGLRINISGLGKLFKDGTNNAR